MNDTLALVGALSKWDAPRLRALATMRVVNPNGIRDWFDLSDALCTPTSVAEGLARLPRPILIDAARAAPDASTIAVLESVALAAEGKTLRCVEASLAALAGQAPLEPSTPPSDALEPLDDTRERATHESALTFVTRIDELLDFIEHNGLKAIARGGIAASDIARVSAQIGDFSADLSTVMALLADAQFVSLDQSHWHALDLTSWRTVDAPARWRMLAEAWWALLLPAQRNALSNRHNWSTRLDDYLKWLYPLDSSWVTKTKDRDLAQAQLLGLTSEGTRTGLGSLICANDASAAEKVLRAIVPAFIDKVLLQSDLTIIAPGPLRPDLESTLRQFAIVESRSLASSYRLNPVLISRAMDAGATQESIETFLAQVSSTGIPQPVSYLIGDIGKKHASVRVRATGRGSQITCVDESIAARIHADSGLTVLELAFAPATRTTLESPRDASVVMRNLQSARYPAVLENDTGEIQRWNETTTRRTASKPPTTTSTVNQVVAVEALIERLLAAKPTENPSYEQWLTRQIDVAIRNKSTLIVTVKLPDATEREFTVDPRALTNGRLRVLDKRSEVERTIPLSSIVALQNVA